jgi:nucleoside-diphosphate kinase
MSSVDELIVAVIDANGVRSGRVEPNKEILTEQGFLIVEQLKTNLTSEQAATFTTVSTQEYDYTSGPVVALLLRRPNAATHMMSIMDKVDDTYASIDSWTTMRDRNVFWPITEAQLQRTLVLVKPEYSQEDYTAILEAIDENDFILIGKLARIVSDEVADNMFNGDAENVQYVTSDVSVALVIEKVGAVDEWQLLMGPEDPTLASAIAPDTLRATLGAKSKVRNVLYASESREKAMRDISSLFPVPFQMDTTLAIIKPDVILNGNLDIVMDVIRKNKFTILASESMNLSQQRAEQFYGDSCTRALKMYMSSGPSQVLVLGKPGALVAWQKLVGPADPAEARQTKPDSLVARFGADAVSNGFHASESNESAKKEIDFFFPQLRVDKLPSLLEVEEALNKKPPPRPHVEQSKSLQDVLVDGLVHLCSVKPIGQDAITYLAHWLLRNNPNKPSIAEPVVEQPKQNVLSQLEEAAGAPAEVVWALGAPGSNRDENVDYIAGKFGHEVLDIVMLLAGSANSGSEYGELIKECRIKGAPIPTHVTVNLVSEALLKSKGQTKFIIKGFPSTMDEAVMFESVVGPVSNIIYFDCTDATKAERIKAGTDEEKANWDNQEFKANVYPIVDQYQLSGKVKKVSTDGAIERVRKQIDRLAGYTKIILPK